MKKKAVRGRPPKPDAEKRSRFIGLKATEAEAAILESAAEAAGEPLSVWILARALTAARRKR